MFNKNNYEQLSDSLQTSGEILYAIEKVSGVSFERGEDGNIIGNPAGELWEEGGRDDKILAALPTECSENNDEVFWGISVFAEFYGDRWGLR